MADKTLTELFTDIANAIMEKDGTNEPIPALNFAERIRNLSAGGGNTEEDTVPTVLGKIAAERDNTEAVKALLEEMFWEDGVYDPFAALGWDMDLSSARVTKRSDGSLDVDNVTATYWGISSTQLDMILALYTDDYFDERQCIYEYLGNEIYIDVYSSGSEIVNRPIRYPKKPTSDEITPEELQEFLRSYYDIGDDDYLSESKRFGNGRDGKPILGMVVRAPLGDGKIFTMRIAYDLHQ